MVNTEGLRLDPLLSVDQISQTPLRRLYQYWSERSGGRAFPARADIDPLDFPFVLGDVLLVELQPPPLARYRYRLVGTNIVRRFGYDLTGRTTEAIVDPDFRRLVEDTYADVVENRRPNHSVADGLAADDRLLRFESIHLPLGSDGVVRMILACTRHDGYATPERRR